MTNVMIHPNLYSFVLFNYDTGKFEVHKYGSTAFEEFDDRNEAIDRSVEIDAEEVNKELE